MKYFTLVAFVASAIARPGDDCGGDKDGKCPVGCCGKGLKSDGELVRDICSTEKFENPVEDTYIKFICNDG